MKKFIGPLLLIFGLGSAISAQAQEDPSALLKGVADKMIAVIEENKEALKTDDSLSENLVRENLLPYIDTQTFSRRTIGSKTWKSMSESQQTAFTQGYISQVINKYAKGLSLYDGEAFEFRPTEFSKKNPNAARVRSAMTGDDGQPFDISYIMSKKSGDWLITNIIVEGTDMRKSYKQQFAPRIKEVGLEKFLEELKQPAAAQ